MKKGLLTSEFWMTLVTAGVVLFNKKIGLDLDPAAMGSVILSVGSYVFSRGWLKAKAAAPGTGLVGQAPGLPPFYASPNMSAKMAAGEAKQ